MHPVWIAVASSALGGSAAVGTRHLVLELEPIAVAFLRYAVAIVVMAAVAGAKPWRAIPLRDQLSILGLGAIMFGLFPWSYAVSFSYTSAATGTIAFCLLPAFTLVLATATGIERLYAARLGGVVLAFAGVLTALSGQVTLDSAVGIAYMLGAAFCGAVFNVYSRSYFKRFRALWVMTLAMAGGVMALAPVALASGSLGSLERLEAADWVVAVYTGALGSALCYLLWGIALERTAPTNVAVTITVAPLVAMVLGAIFLGEPIGFAMLAGLGLVALGIALVNRQRAADGRSLKVRSSDR